MLNEYFVQFGIIIFPITFYQIWTFGKPFNQLPHKTWVMGIYGGLAAILSQAMPVTIFGKLEAFQCVPVVLAILYGKRMAGILSIAILVGYQWITGHHSLPLVWSITAILVYSAVPMVICMRFDRYERRTKFLLAFLMSVLIIVVQFLFMAVHRFVSYGVDGVYQIYYYINFLIIACSIQLVLMGIAFFLLENIIENGRIRKRQESLINYNPLGICAFDINNHFLLVNSAFEAMMGYRESELLKKSRLDLWTQEECGCGENVLEHVTHGEIKQDMEAVLRHKDGHQVPVRFTLVPMVEGESVIGYFLMVRDMTESKVAEEFVRNSEKLSIIGQLAAGVAHEIRNPLTAIKGFLQLLSTSSTPSQSRYYEIMRSEISRIEGILSEMLVLAKPQAAAFETVNVKENLIEVVNLLEGEANMKNVKITMDFCGANPIIKGDANQLKQVFLNLGKNAIEAMPKGGKLKVSLMREEGQMITKFTDEGHGIPKEMLEKIGEPFFTTKPTGTGLGFLISKRIVTSHRGSMNIISSSDKGTTVAVSLPIHS